MIDGPMSDRTTKELFEFAQKLGIPLTEEIFERIAGESFDTFDFVDTLLLEFDQELTDDEWDDMVNLIEVIWYREFRDIFKISHLLEDIGYYEHDLIPDLETASEGWEKIKDAINLHQDPEFNQRIITQYEIIHWIDQYIELLEITTSVDSITVMEEFLEELVQYFLSMNLGNDRFHQRFNYYQTLLGDKYYKNGNEQEAFKTYDQLLRNQPDFVEGYFKMYENYEYRLDDLPEFVDLIYLKDLLNSAEKLLLEENDEQRLEILYERQIRYYQFLKEKNKWKKFAHKLQKIQVDRYKLVEQYKIEYFPKFAKEHHSDDKPLPLDFYCHTCRLGFTKKIDQVLIDYDYALSDSFMENVILPENGKFKFFQYIKCPHCRSDFFVLRYSAKWLLTLINNEAPKGSKVYIINTEQKPESYNDLKQKISRLEKEFKMNRSNPRPLNEIGSYYLHFNFYSKAEKYLKKAAKLCSQTKKQTNKHTFCDSLYALSQIYYQHETQTSIQRAIKYLKQINSLDWKYLKQVNILFVSKKFAKLITEVQATRN